MVLANTKKELKKQIRELKEAVAMLTDQINRLDDSIADDELKLALIDTSRRVEYRSMREAYVRKLSEKRRDSSELKFQLRQQKKSLQEARAELQQAEEKALAAQ